MAKLAIKGHATRGNEVIKILEMLGGCNDNLCSGTFINSVYFINDYGYIEEGYSIHKLDYLQLTLEEFLEKFPYKVGDKVSVLKGSNYIFTIKSMTWDTDIKEVSYRMEAIDGMENEYDWFADELISYSEQKEETMEEELIPRIDFDKYCKDKYLLDLGNYEIKEENGKTYAVRKQFEHPKSYEECCEVLFPNSIELGKVLTSGYNCELLKKHGELLICRDAYWKIAGEQMGLGEPWKPTWKDETEIYYTISYDGVNIKCYNNTDAYSKLAFPTEEMRDAFKENFKELIELCKEFL